MKIYKIDTVSVEKKTNKHGLHLLCLQVPPDKGTLRVAVNRQNSTAMIRGGGDAPAEDAVHSACYNIWPYKIRKTLKKK